MEHSDMTADQLLPYMYLYDIHLFLYICGGDQLCMP